MKKPHHILVAGAGLVGSLLALMLGRRGYRVTVLEKRADMRRVEMPGGRSINLALAERGIHGLRMAGLMEEVEPLLIPMRGRMLHDRKGNLEFSPYGQRPDEVIYSVSRGELNQLMMTAAETHFDVDVLFNQSVETVDFKKNRVLIKDHVCDKTTSLEFELLIGADGVGSEVRTALLEANGGRCTIDMLDHDYKELSIPPAMAGDSLWQMEREALHIWPRGGYMLIALPNLDGSFTVTLFLPGKGVPSFELIDEPHELDQFFDEQFADARALIPDFQQEYFGNPIGQLGTVRCDRWIYQDRAMILGDASHGVVPFHGQGMNAGFEDCSELCRLLDAHDDDWSAVMPEFERIRIPNANAIADMALENYITMRDSVTDEKFQLKKEVGFELERRYPDLFIPRYSMVMFHRIPYADVYARGLVQEEILTGLCENIDSATALDRDRANELVTSRLEPVMLPV
ncbi:MAG: FAD-dependent oxidoreductase [Pirellulaceae bacterium]